jgi:hypothetical protein
MRLIGFFGWILNIVFFLAILAGLLIVVALCVAFPIFGVPFALVVAAGILVGLRA